MFVLFLSLLVLYFLFKEVLYKKARIAPLGGSKFILAPIDGVVTNINTINIDEILFIEITIDPSNFDFSKNLFAPVKGLIQIKEKTEDKVVMTFNVSLDADLNHKLFIEVSHYANNWLKNFSFLGADFFKIYEKSSCNQSMNYAAMPMGGNVKVLIHAANEVIAVKEQSVIGGESILAIINKGDLF